MRVKLWLCFLALLLLPCVPARAAERKRPMTVEDLFKFKRVADPQISPDGKLVAYTFTNVDLAGNKMTTNIWLVTSDGGTPRQLTSSPKHDKHPRWSPDGKRILFESDRSGETQLWLIDMDGGEARQLTTIATEASNGIWSPDGKWIAFVSAVWPEFSDKPYSESNALNKKRIDENAKNPVKAKVFTRLFFRHWNEWVEDKRQHLFVFAAPSSTTAEAGDGPRDVTPGNRDAFPTSDTFSTGDNFTFSPDGNYLVFTAVPAHQEAWSTNYDICRVPIKGGTKDWECLTKNNPAADSGPQFSPDGKRLAYRAQKRAGFEADRWELMVVDVEADGTFHSQPRSLTASFDHWVDDFAWHPGSVEKIEGGTRNFAEEIFFTAEKAAQKPYFIVGVSDGSIRQGISVDPKGSVGTISSLSMSRDGSMLAYSAAGLQAPAEIMSFQYKAPPRQPKNTLNVSQANTRLLEELALPAPENVTVAGADGTPMQMWILKPPDFDPTKKWPLAFLVHGGPQGAWEDGWSYRWCPELWAAQGYVVALPNPRGSTGFGQKYVDEISGDWGGKCYEDLMAGLAYLEKQPYIDTERMAAAGASFGGYMMNWFQGHTTKFKTLITHCGVYNFDSMYALTDELWFDEWEHGGPPWGAKRDSYEKHSPHRYARNFKTPMLIIHNDNDFRVPVAEGLQLFTTLQRLGIPSKMINFPDESHWVLKPANSAYWHREVFAWLKKYAPPGGR
jgi:dipeptidyl aminopeptidase/acylaminoacyl peptidase